MDTLTIENHSDCSEEIRQVIADAIRLPLIQYNLAHIPDAKIEKVILTVSRGTAIFGGLIGRIGYDWLHIELLWLDESIRGKTFGKHLIKQAEDIALAKGCIGAHVDTFSFQAPGFYTQLGYEIFGQLDDHPQGAVRYYLKKSLS